MILIRIQKNRSRNYCFSILLFLSFSWNAGAQQWITRKDSLGFCGLALDSTQLHDYAKQMAFLRLQEGDTLIDIGASSGWFEGVISCLSPVKKHHFVLIDIDSACLNLRTLNRMIAYYSKLKGAGSNYTYDININTLKSLGLSAEKGKKFLLRETLHEIKKQDVFIKELAGACRMNGQVIVIEQLPSKKREKHAGCNDKLLTPADITRLFERQGFSLMEKNIQAFPGVSMQFLRFAKL